MPVCFFLKGVGGGTYGIVVANTFSLTYFFCLYSFPRKSQLGLDSLLNVGLFFVVVVVKETNYMYTSLTKQKHKHGNKENANFEVAELIT